MPSSLVLASSSPRRRLLLGELGCKFTVAAADVDERARSGEAPSALVIRLSRSKAATVRWQHPDSAVLAADTVVVLSGEILGKPSGPAQAVDMLTALRGRPHQVFTAVSLAQNGRLDTRLSCSDVWIRSMSDEDIVEYVATGDPLDKAGAYAIQHPRFAPVDRWDGCYTGIMGLPLGIVAALLVEADLPLARDAIAACERYSGRCCLRGGQVGC